MEPKIIGQLNGNIGSDILLNSDPSSNMEAATKHYIDNKVSNISANSLTDGSHTVSLPTLTQNETFATQSWVNGQSFATQSWVNGKSFATQDWVNNLISTALSTSY